MIARIKKGNILDCQADALIYSTNVLLNCSGGVGACLVERYGMQVQKDLHTFLDTRGIKDAKRGSVINHVTSGMPYKRVFHTVPCDGFYETTNEIIASVLRTSLVACVEDSKISSVALSALGTGYGNLDFEEFFRISSAILYEQDFASLDLVTICIEDEYSYGLACKVIHEESLALMLA